MAVSRLTVAGLPLPFIWALLLGAIVTTTSFKDLNGLFVVENTKQFNSPTSHHSLAETKKQNVASVVLVESRCHSGLLIVLQQAISILGTEHYEFVVWHSKRNEDYVKGLIATNTLLNSTFQRQQLKLHPFVPADYGIINKAQIYAAEYWYSGLLTSSTFWETIKTPWAITLQSDTLICRAPNMGIFNETTFLGGLSGFFYMVTHRGLRKPMRISLGQNPRTNRSIAKHHLNGGFSLHDVSWSMECIRNHVNTSAWVEDDLFNHCQHTLNSSKPVTELQAYSFASDNGNTKCFLYKDKRICPVGVHKPWNLKSQAAKYIHLARQCRGLEQLENLAQTAGSTHQRGENCTAHGVDSVTRFQCNCQ